MLLPEFNSVRPFNLQLQKCKQIWYYIYFKAKTKSPYLGLPAVTWDPVSWKKTKKTTDFLRVAELPYRKKRQLGPAGCYHWQEVYQLTVQQSPPHSTPVGTHRSQRRTERSIHSWNFLVQWEYKFNKSIICIYTCIIYIYICWKHLHSFTRANM